MSSIHRFILILTLSVPGVMPQDLRLACPPALPTRSVPTLKRDWSLLYANCYIIVPDLPLPWSEALATCNRYGGRLAEPVGFTMTEEIGNTVLSSSPTTKQFWTGYNRLPDATASDHIGYWSDGRPTTVDVGVWGDGQPDVSAGDCAFLSLTNGQWTMHMGECDTLMGFMCQAVPCPEGQFRCDSGKCISTDNTCNGENNCGDFSDERYCESKCSYYLTGSGGEITHPASNTDYTEKSTCQWSIEGPIGSRIQLQFLSIDTEKNLDFVEIYIGGRTLSDSSLLYRLSGDQVEAGKYIISPNNNVIVRFVSDLSFQYGGFRFKWSSDFECSMLASPSTRQDDDTPVWSRIISSTLAQCQQQCMQGEDCVAFTFDLTGSECKMFNTMPRPVLDSCCDLYVKSCPGVKGNSVFQNLPNLGGTLYATATPKRLASPLYPVHYLSGATVAWTIIATNSRVVSLEILDIDLPTGDSVTLYDGDGPYSQTITRITQGSSLDIFISTGTRLYVQFQSSQVDSTKRGFLFSYKSGCDVTLTAMSGRITSPGYSLGSYPNILYCTWTITTANPLKLSFDFNFGLENNKDFLQIFEGTDESGAPKHSAIGFTGSTNPPIVQSESGRLHIRLMTSATGTDKGFMAEYKAGCSVIISANLETQPTAYSRFHGDTVSLSCREGYIFATPSLASLSSVSVTCQEGGEWSMTPLPTCSRVFCGTQPAVANGYLVSVEGLYGGDRVTYSCNSGYTASKSAIVCQSDGTWETAPACTSPNCPAYGFINQGSVQVINGNGLEQGSIIKYSCNVGYDVIGVDTLSCNNGQWSALAPTCSRRKCGLPYVENGVLSPNQNVFVNDIVAVICDSGFTLVGTSNSFQCGVTEPPACENVDECLFGLSGCNQLCNDTPGSFTCSCNPGYQVSPFASTACDDVDECATDNGGCDTVCENLPGSYRCICSAGYELYTQNGQGGITIPQGETGMEPWNLYYINHTCIRTKCDPPPSLSIINGKALTNANSFYVGDTISFICDIGYVLQGLNTITCQGANSWNSAVPTCIAAYCPPLPMPSGGNVPVISPVVPIQYLASFTLACGSQTEQRTCTYNQQDNSYRANPNNLVCSSRDCGSPMRYSGTRAYTSLTCTTSGCQFTFECKSPTFTLAGQSLQGDNVVRCGSDGHWDFNDLRCIGPRCPDPGTPPGGSQIASSYEEFSLVYYNCDSRTGFKPTDPYPLVCEYDVFTQTLRWNGTMPLCTDQQSPFFNNCPTTVQQVRRYETLPAVTPQAVDNVVLLFNTSVTPPNFVMARTIIDSDMQVVYTASDYQGNVATCAINIDVMDEELPILLCPNSSTIEINNQFDVQNIDIESLVVAYDNSNSVTLGYTARTLRFDRYDIGTIRTVFVTATDPSNNVDRCMIQYSVTGPCQPWSLTVQNGGTNCRNSLNGYTCDVTCNSGYTFYDPSVTSATCTFNNLWSTKPVCVCVRPTPYRVAPSLRYITNTDTTAECEMSYKSQLTASVTSSLSGLTALCQQSGSPLVSVSTPTEQEAVVLSSFSGTVTATFNLELTPQGLDPSAYAACSSVIINSFATQSSNVAALREILSNGNCAASSSVSYSSTVADGYSCYTLQTQRVDGSSRTCVTCAPGYELQGVTCVPCPQGSYRDAYSAACTPCPDTARKTVGGLTSLDECFRVCPYGMVSPTGEAPCYMCPNATYSEGATSCRQCGGTRTTHRPGQISDAACQNRCPAGYFSKTGLEPCNRCPVAYYQPGVGSTTCQECSVDKFTLQDGRTSEAECVFPDTYLCNSNTCASGSTCIIVDHDFHCLCPPGKTGRTCSDTLRACDSNPCYNKAYCLDQGNMGYTCYCPSSRFSGTHCEIDRNDCTANPCDNYGSCQDKVGAYTCLCPSFSEYTGFRCTTERKPCVDDPCFGGAQCVAMGKVRRKCVCPDGYTGESCNIDVDECLSNPCLNGGDCVNGANSFTCNCPIGYGGGVCEIRQDLCAVMAGCGVSATCVDNYIANKAECFCDAGYQNVSGTCQFSSPCSGIPCENGGTCIDTGSSYLCNCIYGYEGRNCQHNIDDCKTSPCQNGGTCVDRIGGYECQCPTKYPNLRDTSDITQYGANCEDWYNDCTTQNYPCDIVGTVSCTDLYEDYQCTCKEGYYGKNCSLGDTDCASFPCRHGGTCLDLSSNTYYCQCPNGYTGANCQTRLDFCDAAPCAAGSTCIGTSTGYVCSCPPRYTGSTCANLYDVCNIAQPCVGPGSTCNFDGYAVSCDCQTGYGGDNCEVQTIVCTDSTCLYGGTCTDTGGIISCDCPQGTTGDRCEVNLNECESDPCPAGATCVDLVDAYTCVCEPNRIGNTCYKDLGNDFDLVLQGSNSYPMDPASSAQQLGSQVMTLSAWVRFTADDPTSNKVIATLYGSSSGVIDSSTTQLLRIENGRARVTLPGGGATVSEFAKVSDGYWHHVSVVWRSDTKSLSVYLDGNFINLDSYTADTTIPDNIWLVPGGTFDPSTQTIDQSEGMEGRLSRVSVVPRALSASEVKGLYDNITATPDGAVLGLTSDMVYGRSVQLDYNSQLSEQICVAGSSDCRPLSAVSTIPTVSNCPDDQLRVSPRVSTPEWSAPSFTNSDSVRTNIVSGNTELPWGTYGVAFAGSDADGNTAMCTFRLFNRRSSCEMPSDPLLGQSTCTVIDGGVGVRCSLQCNSNNQALAQPGPRFYSCGVYGMYDQADSAVPFQFPACSSCITPRKDITVALTYIMKVSCPASLDLQPQVRTALSNVNADWPDLCDTSSCSSVSVVTVCNPGSTTAAVTFSIPRVSHQLVSAASESKTPSEILAIAIVDDQKFDFTMGSPSISSYLYNDVSVCTPGSQLIGDCCVECAQGTYYSSNTGMCVECDQGTYLSEVGQVAQVGTTPCVTCSGGRTTASTGAQSQNECRDSCIAGQYYNLTDGRCEACPLGYYQSAIGQFYCDACDITLTTASTGSSQATDCSNNFEPVTTTTLATNTPSIGASTAGTDDWMLIIIAIIVVLLIILLIIILLCCCCRGAIERCCPCLVTKVVPEGVSKWHYVDRFGETNMKFVSYKMGDYRAQKNDKQALVSETGSEDGSVATNISVHVPVFEEKLNGTVTKKPVLISNSAAPESRHKEKRPKVQKIEDVHSPKSLPPLPERFRNGGQVPPLEKFGGKLPSSYGSVVVKRPPSAFNKKRPTLDDVPHNEFVTKINVDDEDADYR